MKPGLCFGVDPCMYDIQDNVKTIYFDDIIICQRSAFPCPCVPICCPKTLFPCILRHEIYMEDAQKGLYEIKKARNHRMGLVV
eukprot:gene22579-28714_t